MNDIIFRVIVPDNKILFKTLMLKGERGDQGTSIVSIEKTQTIGLVDYYTITMNDGSTYEFTVQNGTNSYYDSDFSLVSENAVQNKVITAAINAINAALVSIQQYDNALSSSSENAVQNKVVKAAIDSINETLALIVQYDSALSDSSENAVQNKVIKAALDLKANLTALNDYYTKSEVDDAFNNLGASNVGYNNASSGLSATDSQAAIDELKTITDGKANTSSLKPVATGGKLNDLDDVDTSGASTGNILVKGANGYEFIENSYNNLTNKPDFTQKTVTGVGCNVLNGGYVEFGDFIYLSVCVKMTTNHSGDKFLSGLPWNIHDGQCIFGMKTADTNNALVSARVFQGGLYVNTNMGNGVEYTFNGVLCK